LHHAATSVLRQVATPFRRCNVAGWSLRVDHARRANVAGIIGRHRAWVGSGWRKLTPRQPGLLVLVYLRKGERFAHLAAGFGVGRRPRGRYVNQTVALLAARAPKLRTAVRDAKKAGHAYVVLDGTLIPVDCVVADRPFCSGKHRKHRMNLQVIASPDGDVLWVSGGPAQLGSRQEGRVDLRASWTNWRPPVSSP
jgi:Helix-turn-helix of DDE superfamily endonuclease